MLTLLNTTQLGMDEVHTVPWCKHILEFGIQDIIFYNLVLLIAHSKLYRHISNLISVFSEQTKHNGCYCKYSRPTETTQINMALNYQALQHVIPP